VDRLLQIQGRGCLEGWKPQCSIVYSTIITHLDLPHPLTRMFVWRKVSLVALNCARYEPLLHNLLAGLENTRRAVVLDSAITEATAKANAIDRHPQISTSPGPCHLGTYLGTAQNVIYCLPPPAKQAFVSSPALRLSTQSWLINYPCNVCVRAGWLCGPCHPTYHPPNAL
jgi:hypothetical protein